jgi:hypothetical protein
MYSSSERLAGPNFLKVSSATSARPKTAPRPTGLSSAKPRLTPTTAEEFSLSGPFDPPDPNFNAYRKDLADVALAGRVIASHYAEPLGRVISHATSLRDLPSDEVAIIRQLAPGDSFELLDDGVGWAWGYAGDDRRVGYIRTDALDAG